MTELKRFDLRSHGDYREFISMFSDYLREVCGEEELRENLEELGDPELSRTLVEQTLSESNPYFVMRVEADGLCAGLVSYSLRENGRVGFVNNFYIAPGFRGRGVG